MIAGIKEWGESRQVRRRFSRAQLLHVEERSDGRERRDSGWPTLTRVLWVWWEDHCRWRLQVGNDFNGAARDLQLLAHQPKTFVIESENPDRSTRVSPAGESAGAPPSLTPLNFCAETMCA